MAEKSNEVNDVEKVEIESDPDEGEEIIIKPKDIEENETPSESSSEEKQNEAPEEEEGKEGEEIVTPEEPEKEEPSKPEEDKGFVEPLKEEPGDEIKRLPNETPREYALRLEVTRLKRGNREKRAKDLLGDTPVGVSDTKPNELNEDEKAILEGYDQAELGTLEKLLNVLSKKHGWVKKGELESATKSQASNDVLDTFLQDHPEYLPENDKDNLLWNRFVLEFQDYKKPANPRDLKRVFYKIHKDIFGVKPEGELKKINAQKEKLKVVSHSGNSAQRGQSSPKGTRLTPEQKSHLKGFSDNDFKELDL